MISHSGRITIKHVAKEAGVSTQTVSRVINQKPDVAPETRKAEASFNVVRMTEFA